MKRVVIMLLATIFLLMGCAEKDKTIVIDDNVLMKEIKSSNKIIREEIYIPLEDGYVFEPGFFYEDKIYGVLTNQDSEENEFYNAYYSKGEGLVKVKRIEDIEEYSTMSYKSRMVIGWGGREDDNYYIRDNATGDEMVLPEIQITEREEVRTSSPSKDDSGNVRVEFLTNDTNKAIMTSGGYNIIDGNNNFGYRSITKAECEDIDGDNMYYDKIDYNAYENVQSIMVLFDLGNKKTITYDGNLSAGEFPVIVDVMYSKSNDKFYAIGGYMQDEIYEIDIEDDTYNISLFYKFDLDNKLTMIWNSTLVENSIFLESYIPSEIDDDKGFYQTECEKILFSLDTKEINVFEKDNENMQYYVRKLDSNKYLVINRSDIKAMEGKSYLGRVKENKIEYIYEFENGAFNVVMDDEGKKMIDYYISEDGPKYEIYTLDIE